MTPSCRIAVKVIPGAGRDAVDGLLGEEWKVRIRAPAVDGRANEALCAFLAEELGLPRRAVTLVRGEKSRHKVVRLDGLAPGQARATLSARPPV